MEQAFELSDASAERSAAGCTIKLNPEPVKEYLTSNVVLMKNMIAEGYADARSLKRRIEKVEAWLANPSLLEADKDAEYAAVIEIDLADIKEPILCCPNDPDDAKTLSDVAGTKIDEAFIGSCMTNIGHFRAAAKLLGGSPRHPRQAVGGTPHQDGRERADQGRPLRQLRRGRCAHREMPGCSLCIGPTRRRCAKAPPWCPPPPATSPTRLGKNTNVFLASAELAAIASKLGHIPTVAEYHEAMGVVNKDGAAIYKYLNFDQIEEYADTAKGVTGVRPAAHRAGGAGEKKPLQMQRAFFCEFAALTKRCGVWAARRSGSGAAALRGARPGRCPAAPRNPAPSDEVPTSRVSTLGLPCAHIGRPCASCMGSYQAPVGS